MAQSAMLYKPDGGVKEYPKAEINYINYKEGTVLFTNLNNGERIETNLRFVIVTQQEGR